MRASTHLSTMRASTHPSTQIPVLPNRGADDDGSDWQLAVSNVDEDRQQRRQALEGVDDDRGLGQCFGCGGGRWQRTAAEEGSCGGQLVVVGGDYYLFWDMKTRVLLCHSTPPSTCNFLP